MASFAKATSRGCECSQAHRRSAVPTSSRHALHSSFVKTPAGVAVRPARIGPQHAPSRIIKCNGLFGLGLPELAVIAGVAALIFGPSKLPELGKGLGKTLKSFQTAAKEFETELKAASAEDETKPPAAAAETEKTKKAE